MKKLVASLFAAILLVVTSLVFIPGASARNGGGSCYAFAFHGNAFVSWDTPAYNHQSDNSEIHFCD